MDKNRAEDLYKSNNWFMIKCDGLVRGYKWAKIYHLDAYETVPFHMPGCVKMTDEDGRTCKMPLYMLHEYHPPTPIKSVRKNKSKQKTDQNTDQKSNRKSSRKSKPTSNKKSQRRNSTDKKPSKSKRTAHAKRKAKRTK